MQDKTKKNNLWARWYFISTWTTWCYPN